MSSVLPVVFYARTMRVPALPVRFFDQPSQLLRVAQSDGPLLGRMAEQSARSRFASTSLRTTSGGAGGWDDSEVEIRRVSTLFAEGRSEEGHEAKSRHVQEPGSGAETRASRPVFQTWMSRESQIAGTMAICSFVAQGDDVMAQ